MTRSNGYRLIRTPGLPRGLIVLLTIAASVVSVAGIRALASVVAPVVLALMLTIGVHPIFAGLRRRGWPSWLASTVTILSAIGIVLGIAVALAISLAELATVLPSYEAQFDALAAQITDAMAHLGIGAAQMQKALSGVDFGAIAGLLGGLLAGLASTLTNLLFLLALLLFMGVDAATFGKRVSVAGADRPDMVTALAGFVHGTRTYLIVTTVFGLIVAVLDGIALWLMGIPLVLLWALVSFVTNYIPNIGFIIGLVPPTLLGLLQGGPQLALLVIIVYSVINLVIQSVIQPKFVSGAVDLSLTLTFLSLVFWTWVIGPLGAILAVPLTLLVKAMLVDADPESQWMGGLLSARAPADRPALAAGEE